ncbi:hypothetical protein H072_341 [Dactylellina haptotyla CBS 200.50]|uniref:Extracellular membrane protein CFEM domain-containing protein n=1 Tax=Dactylellina haptotyla (strain CBS 200.50) TaxID=1284197 RepID=S8CD96_DACHA|nr:hypothetical protein H072_341 [Dactylellina haptotyla CBS 200.50]
MYLHLVLYLLIEGAVAFLLPRQHDHQGVGHGHSISHGAFNFTPSGIPWPTCPRQCCNVFFDYFPEPVNHPLCISPAFYANVTACVARNCTEYDQGAFAVVTEIECPDDDNFEADDVRADLKGDSGNPQVCIAVENRTVTCENGTSETPSSASANNNGMTWIGTHFFLTGILVGFM